MWMAVIALWETLRTVVDSTSLDGFFRAERLDFAFLELTLYSETMVNVNWFKLSAAVFTWAFIPRLLVLVGAEEEVSRRVCNVSPLGGRKDDTEHVCTFPRIFPRVFFTTYTFDLGNEGCE